MCHIIKDLIFRHGSVGGAYSLGSNYQFCRCTDYKNKIPIQIAMRKNSIHVDKVWG